MTNIDQFESVFRSADKTPFAYERVVFSKVLIVSDLTVVDVLPFTDRVRSFLSVIDSDPVLWQHLSGLKYESIETLLSQVKLANPDLIITYRHLKSDGWRYGHGLGEYADVLVQATDVPVLLLPHPDSSNALPHSVKNTDRVLAVTDHLTGDHRLVNYAVRLTQAGGDCWLTHVEDSRAFEYYLETIARIPEIDTETAARTLRHQLLKAPADYIANCRRVLADRGIKAVVKDRVVMAHRLAEYKQLINEHAVDLLVMEPTVDGQMAISGLAYPLAVELRKIPLLLL